MVTIKFGTDGWRSKVDGDFTTVNVRRVAKGIADYIQQQKPSSNRIFVGYDGRAGSGDFARACAEVFSTMGLETLIPPRPVPTPVAAFAAINFSLIGAVMITASHNPPAYNGIKFIPSYGGPATKDITESIERLIPSEPPVHETYAHLQQIGMICCLDPIEAYIEKLKGLLALDELKIKMVIDPMHGASSGIAESLLKGLGADVRVIRGEIDPDFGGVIPDPTPPNLKDLQAAVLQNGYDLGVALDGDGDRIAAVTEKGDVLAANQILPLLYLHMMGKRSIKGDAARTVATSHLLDKIALAHGTGVIETPVGFKYIGALLRERRIIIGGEESGGISVVTHIPEKDGIASALLLAESIIMSGSTLGEMMNEAYDSYGHFVSSRLDLKLDYSRALSLRELENILGTSILGKRVVDKKKVDGLKLILEDGSWLLFRLSGTESLMRVYAESSKKDFTDSLLEYGKDTILKAQ